MSIDQANVDRINRMMWISVQHTQRGLEVHLDREWAVLLGAIERQGVTLRGREARHALQYIVNTIVDGASSQPMDPYAWAGATPNQYRGMGGRCLECGQPTRYARCTSCTYRRPPPKLIDLDPKSISMVPVHTPPRSRPPELPPK